MEAVQARIDSFRKAKRVKNPTKTSATTSLKWPHSDDFTANPESLAEAGFYYDPSYDDPDNVTCFTCDKQLGGWEEDDDPFKIHWEKCAQTCCWATLRCGLMLDTDKLGRFMFPDKSRVPTQKSMEKARLETYRAGKGWVHDKVKNHGASSKSMAQAGFVYTPQHSGDDLATCLYCNTSLSGWDAEDDPMEEHRTRAAKLDVDCPFFDNPQSQPASRSQSAKPPSKSQSKPPSRSTSRTKHQDAVLPTKTFDGELEDESDAPQTSTTTTTAKTPRKPRSTSGSRKSSAKTPRNKTRSSSRTALKNVEEEDEEPLLEAQLTVKKKPRSRSKSVAKSDHIDQTEAEEDATLEPPPAVKKKTQFRSKSVAKAEIDHTETEDEPVRQPSRSRSKSKAPVAAESAVQLEEEVPRKSSRSKAKASVAPVVEEEELLRKPSRARSKPKVTQPEPEEDEDEPAPEPPVVAKSKPKHQRTASRSKPKTPLLPEASGADSASEQILRVAPPKRTASKSKPQNPEAKDLFNDDIVMDNYVPPPSSPAEATRLTSATDLPPLFVPKRTKANKAPTPQEEETEKAQPEKKKPGRPKGKPKPSRTPPPEGDPDTTSPSSSADTHAPLVPVATNPSKHTSFKDKVPSKSKPTEQSGNGYSKQRMKVVEVSSDEEMDDVEPLKQKKFHNAFQSEKENSHDSVKVTIPAYAPSQILDDPPAKPASSGGRRERKPVIVEPVVSAKVVRPLAQTIVAIENDDDIQMEDHLDPEFDTDTGMYTAPSTPHRPTFKDPPSDVQRPSTPPETMQENSTEPPFIPPLSKLPFMPLHALSDAELDMSVEEWVRYQMEVEHDKFRRDGERELEKFKKRAEEVRRVIEGL